jgi:Divergent InlB B-repeat domain/Cadherin-like beta sandwich domain
MSFPNRFFRFTAPGLLCFLLAAFLSCNDLTDSGKTYIVVRHDTAWAQFDSLEITWKDSLSGKGGILFAGNPATLKPSNPFPAEGYQGQKIVITFLGFKQKTLAYEERRTFDGASPDKVHKEIIVIDSGANRGPKTPRILSPIFRPDSIISIHDSVIIHVKVALDSGSLKQYAWSVSSTGAEAYGEALPLSGRSAEIEGTHLFTDAGIYTVELKVLSQSDSAAIARFRIVVLSDPPTSFAGNDTTVFTGAKINLHGIAKDRLGKVLRTEWRIGNADFVIGSADTLVQAPDSVQEIEAIFRVTDDDSQSVTDTMRIYVVSATESNLTGLQVSQGALYPQFAPMRLVYTDTVPNQINSITVTPEGGGAITVNEKNVSSGEPSTPITLDFGDNAIAIRVRADGKEAKTYTLTVHRLSPSRNADLASLELSAGALSPPFSAEETRYNVWVPQSIQNTTVQATLADTSSSVTVNGFPMASDVTSGTLNLASGSSLITLEVVSEAGVKKSYVVQVTRGGIGKVNLSGLTVSDGALEPTFSPDTLVYNLSLPYAAESTYVTATLANESSTLTIHRQAAVSGKAFPVKVPTGMSAVTVMVKTPGDEVKFYTLIVTREKNGDASLKNLVVSPRTSDSITRVGDSAYTANVSHATDSVTITAEATVASSQISIRGKTLASGQASDRIALAVGSNSIPVLVTAENLATRRYVLTVIRARNGNMELSGIVPSVGTLSPAFDASILDYSIQSGYADSLISITPTLADSRANLQVNGKTVVSGTASAAVKVPVGNKDNSFVIVVTAENLSQRVYNVAVDRLPNSLSTLKSLAVSSGKVVQAPSLQVADTVANGISKVTLQPIASDVNASISVNGINLANGSASDSIPLAIGDNSIPCRVTAQDGKSQTLYTVRITRLAKLSRFQKAGPTQAPIDSVDIPLVQPYAIIAPIVTGYHFVKWSVIAGQATFADSVSATTSVILTLANAGIRADYELNTYALTVNAANCSLARSPDKPVYAHGENVILTVRPHPAYRFTAWSDGSTQNPRTIAMTAPTTLSVTCPAIPTYTVTLITNPPASGSVTTVPEGPAFIEGTKIQLTPVAATGYHFVGWSGDLTGSASPDSLLMNQNRSVTALFELDRFNLKVSRQAGLPSACLVTPSAAQTVSYGAPTAITASAGCQVSVGSCAPIGTVYSYYTFSGWTTVTGTASIASPASRSTTIILTQGNAEIIANYTVETICEDLR